MTESATTFHHKACMMCVIILSTMFILGEGMLISLLHDNSFILGEGI